MDELTDPDHPSCPHCPRFAFGPRAGRVYFRCLPCALRAMHLRNTEKETPRA